MGSRENEKLEKTKRRLAAVAFLTNISLSGSYKDTGWCLEHARQEAAAAAIAATNSVAESACRELIRYKEPPLHGQRSGVTGDEENSLGLESKVESQEAVPPEANHVPDTSIVPLSRFRTNTGSSDASFKSRQRHRFIHHDSDISQVIGHPKHAHFSSAESVEHSARVRQISTSNISECSSSHGNKELKILNLREIPMPKIRDERLVIMLARRTPLLIFSALPYSRNPRHTRSIERADTVRRTRNLSGNRPLSALSDPDPLEQLIHNGDEEVSYGYLLTPTPKSSRMENGNATLPANSSIPATRHKIGEQFHSEISETHAFVKHPNVARCVSYDGAAKLHGSIHLPPIPGESESQDVFESHMNIGPVPLNPAQLGGSLSGNSSIYSPHILDDPEFRAGKHRTLLTFPSYITSVIDYCKASDLKKELNDKFKDRFPNVQLTLSKLRSLKREMRRIAKTECNLDVLTVAQAYVYFEKLILASFVTKYNRKLCSGACLLLSAKLNDVKGEQLHGLMEKIESTFRLNRRDLLSFEFAVLVALEFALHVPTWEVFPHYQRLIYEC